MRGNRFAGALIGVVSALTAAAAAPGCCYLPSGGGAPASAPAPAPVGRAAWSAFSGNLREGVTYGEGPGAEAMARTLRAVHLEPRDGVAVRVSPGTPRRVVAVVRFDDDAQEGLADMGASRRRDYLAEMLATLDAEHGTAGDEVGVGIRGNVFYGAILVRRAGTAPSFETGTVVSTDPLEALCSP